MEMPINNTVKLTESLRDRVAKAMAVEGFTVWSEFCRVALTEKCVAVERNLRTRDPLEFAQMYSRDGRSSGDGHRPLHPGSDGQRPSGVH